MSCGLWGPSVSPAGAILPWATGALFQVGSGADFLEDVKEAKIGPDGEPDAELLGFRRSTSVV